MVDEIPPEDRNVVGDLAKTLVQRPLVQKFPALNSSHDDSLEKKTTLSRMRRIGSDLSLFIEKAVGANPPGFGGRGTQCLSESVLALVKYSVVIEVNETTPRQDVQNMAAP